MAPLSVRAAEPGAGARTRLRRAEPGAGAKTRLRRAELKGG